MRDLRGLRAAITSKGQSTEMLLAAALAQAGLSLGDVELNELAYPDMNLALANRNIDAAVTIEPFAAQAVSQGFAARFKDWGDVLPNDHMAMVMYSAAFTETRDRRRAPLRQSLRTRRARLRGRAQPGPRPRRDRHHLDGVLAAQEP